MRLGCKRPAREIALPAAGAILGGLRGNETGKHGSDGIVLDETHDGRKNALHPGRRPKTARAKNILHVDAEMHRAGDRFCGR